MQMGALSLKTERVADAIDQIPSPHIKPETTAPAYSSEPFSIDSLPYV